jgi:hypothetical protein
MVSSVIIIIIVGKTPLFELHPSLEDSAGLHPVFASLDFATVIFYREIVASNTQPRGRGPYISVPQ